MQSTFAKRNMMPIGSDERMSRSRRVKNNRGFSVIEVMITLAIIAVLAGVAVPNLSGRIPTHRLNSAAKSLAWNLMAARLDAIRHKRNVTFSVTSSHTYKVWMDTDKDGNEDADEIEIVNIHDTYQGVTLASSKSPTFTATGTVLDPPTTGLPITIANVSGSKTITISSAGLVRVN